MKTLRVTNRGILARDLGRVLILPAVLLALACDSMTEPGPPVTLLVWNATCSAGVCSSIEIRGFPTNQPNTPGGLWSVNLGAISTPAVCITFPTADTFRVTNADTGKTTIFVWTIDDGIALGTWEPGKPAFTAMPSTSEFVPGTAEGWSITLPGGTAASPATACLAVYPD